MSVKLHLPQDTSEHHARSVSLCANSSSEYPDKTARSLHIGLVNNMPDSALEATERQFIQLLEKASEGTSVTLSLYTLPGIERTGAAEDRIRNCYDFTDSLPGQQLDGIIVTGREPLAPHLSAEPYWHAFTNLVHWAQENTSSAIWSCLAAHAVLYHLDGIERVKSSVKHFGVFRCSRLSDHPLMAGLPAYFRVPHSRWNGLPPESLARHGYRMLSHADNAGVDIFVKEERSLFFFVQGHPEYDTESLMLEYRRDAGRYLRGETDVYPPIPEGYFDYSTRCALLALQKQAQEKQAQEKCSKNNCDAELCSAVSSILSTALLEKSWAPTATLLYKNWLNYLLAHKPHRDTVLTTRDMQPALVPQIAALASTPSL